jgi:hypothetical protein
MPRLLSLHVSDTINWLETHACGMTRFLSHGVERILAGLQSPF